MTDILLSIRPVTAPVGSALSPGGAAVRGALAAAPVGRLPAAGGFVVQPAPTPGILRFPVPASERQSAESAHSRGCTTIAAAYDPSVLSFNTTLFIKEYRVPAASFAGHAADRAAHGGIVMTASIRAF
ncbi:MAG: hypothetical protein NTZ05_03970 [Chloroflexi bacterium]|nr:hypothetical protein [Chloroflexota bacterium]